MSPHLGPIKAGKLIKILAALGFEELRTRGSHKFFIHKESGLTTVVPVHTREEIGVGLLRKILRDINLDLKDFEKLKK